MADGFTSTIQDSIGIAVQGAAIQTSRIGSSYSVTGVNVSATGPLGLSAAPTAPTASTAIVPTPADFSIVNSGQQFSLSEQLTVGDSTLTQTVTTGVIASPLTYGTSTTQLAGDKGTLAAVIDTTAGTMGITAGGAGTSATATRTVSLTAF